MSPIPMELDCEFLPFFYNAVFYTKFNVTKYGGYRKIFYVVFLRFGMCWFDTRYNGFFVIAWWTPVTY